MSECKIVGPYMPAGFHEWTCVTHDEPAVLRDPSRWGANNLRRDDFEGCALKERLTKGDESDE